MIRPGFPALLLSAGLLGALLGASTLAIVPAAVEAQSAAEELVAAGDWQGLLAAMSNIPTAVACKSAIVDRMLLAHASMAGGHMGKAVELFYCPAGDSSEFDVWESWTRDLARKHADCASCAYLRGDALLRKNEMDQAIAEFTRALTLGGTATDSALVLNARGVGRWILFERTSIDSVPDSGDKTLKEGAQNDLIAAKRVTQRAGLRLADCDANQAIVEFRNHLDLDRVAGHFQEAFDADPTFFLALNGHACTRAAAMKREAFLRDMTEIARRAPGTPFLATNAGGLVEGVKANDDARRGWEFGIKAGVLAPSPIGLVSGSVGLSYDEIRGGFYTILEPGKNMHVTGGQPEKRVVGTWFALDYPLRVAPTSEGAPAHR